MTYKLKTNECWTEPHGGKVVDKVPAGTITFLERFREERRYETACNYSIYEAPAGTYPIFAAVSRDNGRVHRFFIEPAAGVCVESFYRNRLFSATSDHKNEDVGKAGTIRFSLDADTIAKDFLGNGHSVSRVGIDRGSAPSFYADLNPEFRAVRYVYRDIFADKDEYHRPCFNDSRYGKKWIIFNRLFLSSVDLPEDVADNVITVAEFAEARKDRDVFVINPDTKEEVAKAIFPHDFFEWRSLVNSRKKAA